MGKYAVFGLGYVGKWFVKEIGSDKVTCIIDNNKEIQGTYYDTVPVISLDEYISNKYEIELVISSLQHKSEIMKQLSENGITRVVSLAKVWGECKLCEIENRETIYLMNTHSYTNGGDYLITIAEKKYLSDVFKNRKVVLIPSMVCEDGVEDLKKYIGASSLLLISGGGYLGNLWMDYGENNVRSIVRSFPQNRIVVLPQSIFYTNDPVGLAESINSQKVYSEHDSLEFCLRDENSYKLAKKLFGYKCVHMIPDMTFYLKSNYDGERNGCALCLRQDKESKLDKVDRSIIVEKLKRMALKTDEFNMEIAELLNEDEAENAVKRLMARIGKFELVITDRLHCMMMCYITGTPCIAFDNVTSKVSGTYNMFSKKIPIRLITKTEEIESAVCELQNMAKEVEYNDIANLYMYDELTRLLMETYDEN